MSMFVKLDELTQQLFDGFGIDVVVDGKSYRALINEDRTEFCVNRARPLTITTGSEITDERGKKYMVEQCMETMEGLARLRVRSSV